MLLVYGQYKYFYNVGSTREAKSIPALKDYMFYPLEVVSHYRDPQLQVGEIYSYFLTL